MDRKIKKVPIIMTCNYARSELVEQSMKSINNNTEYPNDLIYTEDYNRGSNKLNYLVLRNELVKDIYFEWDYIVFIDDDIYVRKGWLKHMIEVYNDNEDVYILAGTRWPGHKITEIREDISISEEFGGGCLLMSKDIWNKVGPFAIKKEKTIILWEKVHRLGGKIATLNDESFVIHCGVKSIINSKGRSKLMVDHIKGIAKKYGAKTN